MAVQVIGCGESESRPVVGRIRDELPIGEGCLMQAFTPATQQVGWACSGSFGRLQAFLTLRADHGGYGSSIFKDLFVSESKHANASNLQ